jgi:hypothetical protein
LLIATITSSVKMFGFVLKPSSFLCRVKLSRFMLTIKQKLLAVSIYYLGLWTCSSIFTLAFLTCVFLFYFFVGYTSCVLVKQLITTYHYMWIGRQHIFLTFQNRNNILNKIKIFRNYMNREVLNEYRVICQVQRHLHVDP